MKLYVTTTSSYVRIARAVVLEKGFADSVEIINAITRRVDSPYYSNNPSGRVPYLECDDGVGEGRPQLAKWAAQMRQRPSLAATAPIRGN
jgi:glutathione S-transferase